MAKANNSGGSSNFMANEDAIKRIKNLLEDISKLEKNLTAEDTVQLEIIQEKQKKLQEYRKDLIANRGIVKSTNDLEEKRLDSIESLSTKLKDMPGIYEEFSKELKISTSFVNEFSGYAKNINHEFGQDVFQRVSDSLQTGVSLISEMASLNKEDVDAIAKKNFEIDNSIKAIEKEKEQLAYAGLLTTEMSNKFDESVGFLNQMRGEAAKFAGVSKHTKEIYSELFEDLEGINKTFKKITTTIEVFFSSGKNMVGMLLIGAGHIVDKFGELGKELGVGITEMAGLKTQALLVGAILGEDAGKAAIDLAKDLGDSHHLTTGMALDAGLLAANYGLAAKEAAFMSVAFGELSGKSYETGKNTTEYVKQLSMANGVAPAQVMGDIAQNTEFFAIYSKDGGKNIGEAAVVAAKLGVSLSTASTMANHLLDYQNSVNDEMEASVILGKDINLNKARELAYNGDIAGSMKEGLKAIGGIEKYNKMTPYERQAAAKALGISNAELQQMVSHEENLKGYHGVGQQYYSRIEELIQSIGNSLGGKVLDFTGKVVLMTGQYSTALKAIKEGPLSGIYNSVAGLATKMWGVVAASAAWLGNLVKAGAMKVWSLMGGKEKANPIEMYQSLRDKGMGASDALKQSGAKASDVLKSKIKAPEKLEEGVTGITAAGDEASKGDNFESVKEKFTNLAAGLKEMGTGKVLLGAFNLIPAGIGLAAMLVGLPTLWLMGKMDFGNVLTGFENLALGLDAMGTGNVMAGAGALLLTSIALIAMIPGLAVMALMGLSAGLITVGSTALAGGLEVLGTAAATGLPFLAVGLLLALGASFVVFGYALRLISNAVPGFLSLIRVFTDALPKIDVGKMALFGLALIPFGAGLATFGALSPLILLGAGALMLLGMALSVLAPNLPIMSSVMPQIVENLTPLVGMIMQIFSLAAAITFLAGALALLGTMGAVAIPVLLALGAVGAVAGMLFGGGGGKDDKQEEMITLLRSIDSKVGNVPAVQLDGKQVSTNLNINSQRQGTGGKR